MKHIEKKKIGEFQAEMEQITGLTSMYLPLNSAQLRDALHSRRIDLEHDAQQGDALIVHDYVKPGDELRITLNMATMQMRRVEVRTYLESPKDALTADAEYSMLGDRTLYPSISTVTVPAQKISISTVTSDFSRPVN